MTCAGKAMGHLGTLCDVMLQALHIRSPPLKPNQTKPNHCASAGFVEGAEGLNLIKQYLKKCLCASSLRPCHGALGGKVEGWSLWHL